MVEHADGVVTLTYTAPCDLCDNREATWKQVLPWGTAVTYRIECPCTTTED